MFCARADIDRVLDVLIENALNYSAAGCEVGIEVAPAKILITDQGEGLEPGEEETVFERFTRGRAGSRGVDGTGLGLSIARELAGQWGASVALESRAQGGARATLEFSRGSPGEPGRVMRLYPLLTIDYLRWST